MSHLLRVGCLSCLLALALGADPPPDHAITFAALDGSKQQVTIEQLRKQFELTKIDLARPNAPAHIYGGIRLGHLLESLKVDDTLKMDPKADPARKNLNLRLVLVVRSADGYTVTLAVAELLPGVRNELDEPFLALEEDGQPLPARDGPARLIVPADQKPARWVRQVAEIDVIDPTAATQPTIGR